MHLNLLHNPKLKGMALLLAVLSWSIVKQITNNDKTIQNVPVQINLPEGWAIRDKDLAEVEVTFRGTREALLLLDERTVQVLVDLRESEFEPVKTVQIEPRQVAYTGSSARIIDIRPAKLELQLGKEGHKSLPVIVNRIGDPPKPLRLESIESTPSLVTLYGAEDLLQGINSLQTAPLSLTDKSQSFEQRLEIIPPNPEWVGRIDPPRIRVKVTLTGLTVERKFEDIPLLLYHAASEATTGGRIAEPAQVDVFLKGSPEMLDELDTRRIKAFVSVDAPKEPLVDVLVPPGIEVLGIDPPRVKIRPLAPPPSEPSRPPETP
jgi:YbbR domain-containing protein